ncbi:DUF6520 family protein [Algoriphagus sp.]|uniref:DUF6520 family protein n=1 Tax=Algoriphagus sp. TaxID=1872435 RepID=UPI00261B7825|nr:DUF6520 family protein [Algoriphagus sp.]
MIKFKNLLPALAMVLGATLAMAMNFANPSSENSDAEYGTPDGGITWVRVNDPQNPVNYQCDLGSEACLYSEPNLMNPIGTTDKKFVLIP